jgi:hypothetical protein
MFRALTKEYESSWIFEPRLTCVNALRRVQHPGFSLVRQRFGVESLTAHLLALSLGAPLGIQGPVGSGIAYLAPR